MVAAVKKPHDVRWFGKGFLKAALKNGRRPQRQGLKGLPNIVSGTEVSSCPYDDDSGYVTTCSAIATEISQTSLVYVIHAFGQGNL
ncbi:hypothetical protein MTO96_023376 [Rhipicephalus appendiculatus]